MYNKQNLSPNEAESIEGIYGKGDCYSNTKKLYALSIPKLPVAPCLGLKDWEKFETWESLDSGNGKREWCDYIIPSKIFKKE